LGEFFLFGPDKFLAAYRFGKGEGIPFCLHPGLEIGEGIPFDQDPFRQPTVMVGGQRSSAGE
jgi:hypothetical protein